MGCFLCIGLNVGMTASRKELGIGSMSFEEAKAAIEKSIANPNLYNVEETDTHFFYSLKEEIVMQEWKSFIENFYRIRYHEINSKSEDAAVIERISSCNTLKEWMDIAKEKRYECYQTDSYYSRVDIGTYYSYYVSVQSIILSITGKIVMECYNDLFLFLRNCIKKRLEHYRLADALNIYISE